jgi:flagellar motor switch protein FliM
MAEENEEMDAESAAAMAEWESMMGDDAGGDAGGADADADAAAAEWEKMAAGGGDAGGEDTADEEEARVLNQDEIDLLLGFESADDGSDNNVGIKAILDRSMMAYEKLPMLEVVFDRMVRMLSSSLRNFTSDNVDVSIDSMTSLRFEDYLNTIPLPALLTVFRAVEWENFGLITVDSSQIYSTVDILLGGRRATRPIRIEGRPYTTIEQDIVKKMVEIVLSDMSSAFDPVSPVNFTFDRLENNPRFAGITRPNSAALLVKLRVDMDERGGMVEILLPHNTLEPVRDHLLQMFMGEKFGADSVWERYLGREVRQSAVEIEAVLDERPLTLGEVMNLKVGSTIMLNAKPNDMIKLRSGDVSLSQAKLGKVGDKIAVSLVDDIKQKKEVNEWLS